MRILLIEDEAGTAEALQKQLSQSYVLDGARTGKNGAYLAGVNEYDLIILDLSLPDMDGVEVCKAIRAQGVQSPILILTGRANVGDKVTGLDAGADDYLTKPFSFDELSARIRALLRRRAGPVSSDVFSCDGLTLDVGTRKVERDGVPIVLRRKEFDLLEYLLSNQGRVVTREMILEHLWDASVDLFTNVVDVHIKYLRDKVDKPFGTTLIKTVHGLGYKIEAEPRKQVPKVTKVSEGR